MGQGDISKQEYENIIKVCIRCLGGSTWTKYGIQDPLSRISRTVGGGVIRVEIANLLQYFKTNMLSTLTT